jgi:hypothetical protein
VGATLQLNWLLSLTQSPLHNGLALKQIVLNRVPLYPGITRSTKGKHGSKFFYGIFGNQSEEEWELKWAICGGIRHGLVI